MFSIHVTRPLSGVIVLLFLHVGFGGVSEMLYVLLVVFGLLIVISLLLINDPRKCLLQW